MENCYADNTDGRVPVCQGKHHSNYRFLFLGANTDLKRCLIRVFFQFIYPILKLCCFRRPNKKKERKKERKQQQQQQQQYNPYTKKKKKALRKRKQIKTKTKPTKTKTKENKKQNEKQTKLLRGKIHG